MRADRLREMREVKALTQQDLASLCNVSLKQYWRYENEDADPPGDVLKHLAQALEVSVDYLLGLVDDPSGRLREEDLSPMERKLIQAFRLGRIVEATKAFAALAESVDQSPVITDKPAID
jgi:transcriptional regulator with XRE-family HTH domain